MNKASMINELSNVLFHWLTAFLPHRRTCTLTSFTFGSRVQHLFFGRSIEADEKYVRRKTFNSLNHCDYFVCLHIDSSDLGTFIDSLLLVAEGFFSRHHSFRNTSHLNIYFFRNFSWKKAFLHSCAFAFNRSQWLGTLCRTFPTHELRSKMRSTHALSNDMIDCFTTLIMVARKHQKGLTSKGICILPLHFGAWLMLRVIIKIATVEW